jgi:hypothetical protein
LPVFDHLTAGAQVHGDNGHARSIRFCQNQPEPLRDSVQMDQSAGTREQLIFFRNANGSDIADFLIIDVRFDHCPIIDFILDDASDDQTTAAQAGDLNGQMNALVRVNAAEKD